METIDVSNYGKGHKCEEICNYFLEKLENTLIFVFLFIPNMPKSASHLKFVLSVESPSQKLVPSLKRSRKMTLP